MSGNHQLKGNPMTYSSAQRLPRNDTIAKIWAERPERLVTCSTGVVHVGVNGRTMCGTRVAVRVAAEGIIPTCQNCGAVPA